MSRMITFRVHSHAGGRQILVGLSPEDACHRAAWSFEEIRNIHFSEVVVFVAVVETSKTGTAFVKKFVEGTDATVNLVGKIDATRMGDGFHIASPTGIGINIDIDGVAKTFINGDQIQRTYKAFALDVDAQEWILAEQRRFAQIAG